MKKHILILCIVALFIPKIHSQQIVLKEHSISLDKKQSDAWSVELNEDQDLVMKGFHRYMKDKYDVTPSKKNKTTFTYNQVVIPPISQKAGDLKGLIHMDDNGLFLSISFFFGYDIYVNYEEYPEEMDGLRELLLDFIVDLRANAYKEEIAEDEKRLAKMSAQLSKSEKTVESVSKQLEKTSKSLLKADEKNEKDELFDLNNKKTELEGELATEKQLISNLQSEIDQVSGFLKMNKDNLTRLQMEAVELRQ